MITFLKEVLVLKRNKTLHKLSISQRNEGLAWLRALAETLRQKHGQVADFELYEQHMGYQFPILVISPKNRKSVNIAIQIRTGLLVSLLFDYAPWLTGLALYDDGDAGVLLEAVDFVIEHGVLKRKYPPPKHLRYEPDRSDSRFVLLNGSGSMTEQYDSLSFEAIPPYYSVEKERKPRR